ncbi:flagellar biosynthesis regulator FlaF [Terrarubrum flagellatum]|uniref:flagellar biosynthesis regulator FlaF n=1 Tax=Terrirubrum flagellatum TaxID=2895980 RepID=UPI0031456155
MSYGASAYSKASVAKEVTPRELEASLLMKGAAKLEAVKRDWDAKRDLPEALAFNRKLWTILATSVTSEENPLPQNVKQDFANLSIFILKTLISLAAEPTTEKLTQVAEINATIAAGLRS